MKVGEEGRRGRKGGGRVSGVTYSQLEAVIWWRRSRLSRAKKERGRTMEKGRIGQKTGREKI